MRGIKPEMRIDPEAITDLRSPDWMAPDAAAEWGRVMPILAKRRILSVADLGSLENYCLAIGTVREMDRHLQLHGHIVNYDGALKRNPAVGIQSDAMTRARLLAAELGLTPVSRSRPAIREDEDDDDENPLDIS
ncbi:MAG: phage terminase small subunit P27 family [Pseudooceanicola sp.]|nr:phage terminase small subunit P27 family [Pseudooceanicola sp.]